MATELIEPRDQPTERQGLVDFLEYQRQVIRRKVEGLKAADLTRTTSASALTLGGLIKHLSWVEDIWFLERIAGEKLGEPWANVDWSKDRDWDFNSAGDDSPEYLLALYDAACQRSRDILADVDDLDALLVTTLRSGARFNVRWVLIHMIEEYARHAGHADLIRESIDGVTGD